MSSLEFNSITATTKGKKTAVETTLRFADEGSVESVSIAVLVPTTGEHTLRSIQVEATHRAIKLLQMTLPE